jgi:porin
MRKVLTGAVTVAVLFTAFARGGAERQGGQAHDTTKVVAVSNDVTEGRPGTGIKTIEVEEPQADFWNRSTLTGNWNGKRDALSERGITFTLSYKADNISNLSGGLVRRASYLHNIDLLISADAEKLLGWSGATFRIHAMSNNGKGFRQYVGDAQGASNIDAPKMTKLYQAFVQQNVMDNRLSFLAGLYDLNAEFYVVEAAQLFLNRSFSVGKELAQSGQNGPSIFPTPAGAIRLKIQPSKAVGFRFAAFDAVPGSPSDPTSPSLFMSMQEGALVVGEVSYRWNGIKQESIGKGKYTIGAWFYTSAFTEDQRNAITGRLVRSTANNGIYFLAEQIVFAEQEAQGLALFTRLGLANGSINQYNYNFSAGVVYTGVFPERDADRLGIAFTHANNSSDYRLATLLSGSSVATGELAIEFTYRAQVTPWLAVQPDYQYIIHPGTDPLIENASVFGTRFEVGF